MPMPNTVNYPQIIPFISKGKMDAIKNTFGNTLTDRECYGIYIWSQKASAAIYPLLQELGGGVGREGRVGEIDMGAKSGSGNIPAPTAVRGNA